jgi:hypothetical protein
MALPWPTALPSPCIFLMVSPPTYSLLSLKYLPSSEPYLEFWTYIQPLAEYPPEITSSPHLRKLDMLLRISEVLRSDVATIATLTLLPLACHRSPSCLPCLHLWQKYSFSLPTTYSQPPPLPMPIVEVRLLLFELLLQLEVVTSIILI